MAWRSVSGPEAGLTGYLVEVGDFSASKTAGTRLGPGPWGFHKRRGLIWLA